MIYFIAKMIGEARTRGAYGLTDRDDEQFLEFERLMARFTRLTQRKLSTKSYGLTASQIFILRFLSSQEQAKASDIARASGLSPGAVTQICDELVKDGYVHRTRSQDDRRVVYISITDYGRSIVNTLMEERRLKMRVMFQKLGTDDASEFIRIISKVADIAENELDMR